MQTTITQNEAARSIRRLKFPPQIEKDFQQYYYSLVRIHFLISLFIIVGLTLLCLLVNPILNWGLANAPAGHTPINKVPDGIFPSGTLWFSWSACLVNFLLLALTFRRDFAANWQAFIVGTICISECLFAIQRDLISLPLYAGLCNVLIFVQLLRLQIRWLVLWIMLSNIVFYFLQGSHSISQHFASILISLTFMSLPVYLAFRNERAQRSKFAEQLLLTQERHQEHQKLEQTEKMLHVLGQAIGSIAHDLGNPLTIVHGSAETLKYLIKEDALDKKTELEFLEMIMDGAQMLNYLRLSLMEQTRVLEGKPILVELQATDVRHLVEAGARYQQPKFSAGRHIAMEGENLGLLVDTTRFITVFMNLIGNAFKYSDGEVKVTWRTDEGRVLVGVLDQGQKGRGISQAQAERLFVPFGRLDTHTQVEGTGLGLLSVRKIVEAHEGEAYIEGKTDGAMDSSIFSSAQGSYPRVLQDGFCTAFVTAFPLKTAPHS
jgi:signal transduction histidine kinase